MITWCILTIDSLSDMDMLDVDDGIELNVRRESPSLTDLMRDFQYQSYQPYQSNHNHLSLMDSFAPDWGMNLGSSSEILNNHHNMKDDGNDEDKEEEETYEENSSDSLSSSQEQPISSLFNVAEKRDWPWKRNNVPGI